MDAYAQKAAYEALNSIFTRYEPQHPRRSDAHGTISIEVLPQSIKPPDGQLILEDEAEKSIGVPKKVLVAGFLHARNLFMSTHQSEREDKNVRDATRVILLYDPEFITAANARKQYLLNMLAMKQAYGPMHEMMLTFAVQSELWFLTSVLTSPLHRQSKSPTLWWHRIWLYKTFYTTLPRILSRKQWIIDEVETVLKAAEMHQHNYYAFQYARRVLLPAIEDLVANGSNDEADSAKQAVLKRLLAWCKAHPSDTSGWSFLASWIQQTHNGHEPATLQTILNFATDLQWKGEALWSFLRLHTLANAESNLAEDIRTSMTALCPKLALSEHAPT